MVAWWLAKNGTGSYAYEVQTSVSRDGTEWSRPATPHTDRSLSEHGFVSAFPHPDGGIGLVWLDGRGLDVESSNGGHDEVANGAMALYTARLDAEGRPTGEAALDARVCDCCPTAAAVSSRGVLVAYRDRSRDEVRDIGLMRLGRGEWRASPTLHKDEWVFPACPVNGPALSAEGQRVAAAWFTGQGDRPRVHVRLSGDGGRTFRPPVIVSRRAALGRVAVVLLEEGAAVAWMEMDGDRAALLVRRVGSDGSAGPLVRVADLSASRRSGYPRLVRQGNRLVAAWTDVDSGTESTRLALASIALPLP